MTDTLDPALQLWMSKPAPRYTSYPPAPFFHDGVGEADYAATLARLGADELVSIYMHIPFCAEMCLFCGCHTYITKREDRISAYLQAMIQEMRLAAAKASHKMRMSHLHFGGGTPNALSPADMDSLFSAMRDMFDFSACKEIAMEVDPRTLTREHVKAMKRGGVTRVSLGVQDFNPEVQKLVHRIQPYERVAEVCGWLRDEGITRINFDLMYGLPAQTPESVAATAKQAIGLNPDRFALFSYAHVPTMRPHQKALNEHGIPDGMVRLEMERAARDAMEQGGYVAVGMDHFAKPDDSLTKAMLAKTMRRNFQGYTDDAALTMIAFGASAIGQTRDGFVQNQKETRAYQKAIEEGHLPIIRGYKLTDEDRVRSAIIEQLMCYFACDVEAVCAAHAWDVAQMAASFENLKPFVDAGIIGVDGWKIRLTTPYLMAIRSVAFAFDTHAANGSATYSKVA